MKAQARGYFSWRAALLFATVITLCMYFFVVAMQRYQERLIELVLTSQLVELAEASDRLTEELKARTADLALLTNLPELVQLQDFSSPGPNDTRASIENYFIRFLEAYPEYDQIRLIDPSGREQINILRKSNAILVTPSFQLQDKSGRYYVKEALARSESAVYLSRFDLNREFGAVQQPLKPTVRIVQAVVGYDAHNKVSRTNGLVVLNLSIEPLLERFRRALVNLWQSDVFIVDENGYFILHPDAELQWGFDRGFSAHRIERYFPHAWAQIKAGASIAPVASFDGQSVALQRYQQGGHFLSYAFQLPGIASTAPISSEPFGEAGAHRYRALMFVASERLSPWALRNHWVWWALLLFVSLLLLLTLIGWRRANRQHRRAERSQALGAELSTEAQQLREHNGQLHGRIVTLRELLRELRNSAATVVGFSSLVAQSRGADQAAGLTDELNIIDRSAKDLLATLDEAQRALVDGEGSEGG